jgi:hypothetical protein
MDEEIPPSPKILSRATIFEVNSAQPRYPPYIFTRSDAETLKFNIGRIIPVFRHITTDWGRRFVSDGGGGGVTMSILQAHIASTSRATKMRTEGVEEDVVLALIEL